MRKFVVLLGLALLFACEKNDSLTEQSLRYEDEVFAEVAVHTEVYSQPYGLQMDVYQPVGDSKTDRPVVVLAHGGGFVGGFRNNPAMVRLGQNLAKRGYVAVSITYRLAPSFQSVLDSNMAADMVMKAIGDARAAVRYLRKTVAEDGNPLGINPDAIFMGGNSAGAVLAIHVGFLSENDSLEPFFQTAMQANGGFQGNGGNAGYSSEVKAVFNLAGGIARTRWIDAGDVPSLHFHGVDDDIVPYECGDVYQGYVGTLDVINLCGSKPINDKANSVGLQSTLNTYAGAHVPWMDSNTGVPLPLFDEVEQKVFDFLLKHL